MNQDVVFTTQEAIKYLRISKPTFLKYISALEESMPLKQETAGESTNPNYIDF
jgi:response regulator of citrate/malate metabolism